MVDSDVVHTARVGVVMVSFNTMSVTSQAIYALFRHVRRPSFRLVVVDNGSTDGSAEMLTTLASAGLCELVLNAEQRYHGPGLNQAIDHLVANRVAGPGRPIRYVLVLDSDCIVLRPDVLSSALSLMAATGAGLLGQRVFDDWHHGDMMGLHCLLLDLEQVWVPSIPRFEEHGSPSEHLQRSAIAAGVRAVDFPFTRDGYAVHLGRATLEAIARSADHGNRYFDWATGHKDPHFMGEPDAPARYAAFLRSFTADVGDVTPANVTAACSRFVDDHPIE